MVGRMRRRRPEPPAAPRLVVVTYMTRAGMGVCRLRDPRWCYRRGVLAFVGEYHPGAEIGFDFEQILTLETVPKPEPALSCRE
jgi:hypothetical protein